MKLSDIIKDNEYNGSASPFGKRQNITKTEQIKLLDAKLSEQNRNEVQIRIMGDLEKSLIILKKISEVVNVENIGMSKLEVDKKNRTGNFKDDEIRIYMKVR